MRCSFDQLHLMTKAEERWLINTNNNVYRIYGTIDINFSKAERQNN